MLDEINKSIEIPEEYSLYVDEISKIEEMARKESPDGKIYTWLPMYLLEIWFLPYWINKDY